MVDEIKRTKAYYDLVTGDRSKKYGLQRRATAEEIAAEMQARDCHLTEGKTVYAVEGYAPGGVFQGAYDKPGIVRGSHEMEEVEQII